MQPGHSCSIFSISEPWSSCSSTIHTSSHSYTDALTMVPIWTRVPDFNGPAPGDIFTMQARGPTPPLAIHFNDNMEQEIFTLTQPPRCTLGCFACCLQELDVQSPPDKPIGCVEQNWHPTLPEGACLMSSLRWGHCMSKTMVECISKQWCRYMQELTDADNFGISFPVDLDVKLKGCNSSNSCSLLISSWFLWICWPNKLKGHSKPKH